MSAFFRLWLCALMLLVGCGTTATDESDGPVGPLADPAYAFCHDADAEWSTFELDLWCPLLDGAAPDSCEGLRAACDAQNGVDRDRIEPPPSGCNGSGAPPAAPPPRAATAPPPPPVRGQDLSVTEAFGQIVRWTIALVVALLVVGLILLVIRVGMRWTSSRTTIATTTAVAPEPIVVVPDADEVPDLPSQDLLAAARAALAEGRFEDSVLLARGAALRSLGDSGRVRLHSSRTDREYVRSLRRDRESQTWLRVVVNAVEGVRWGGRPLRQADAAQVLAAAAKLVSVALVMLLCLFAATPAQADDYAADGDAALLALFQDWGFESSWRLRSIRSIDSSVQVLVLDAQEVYLDEEDGLAVRGWVEDGGVLIIGGSLAAFPELGTLSIVDRESVRVSVVARDAGLAAPILPGGVNAGFTEARGQPWVVMTSEGADPTVVVQAVSLGSGGVIGISESLLLSNGALVADSNAALLGGSVAVGQRLGLWSVPPNAKLELATIAGEPSSNTPFGAMANARLLPVVLQLLAVLALVGLWKGIPFGPLRDPPSEGRVHFSDHAVALGRRFRRSGSSRYAASRQAELWLRRLGPLALEAAAERHGYSPDRAKDLVSRAQELADAPDGANSQDDFTLVEELCRITKTP